VTQESAQAFGPRGFVKWDNDVEGVSIFEVTTRQVPYGYNMGVRPAQHELARPAGNAHVILGLDIGKVINEDNRRRLPGHALSGVNTAPSHPRAGSQVQSLEAPQRQQIQLVDQPVQEYNSRRPCCSTHARRAQPRSRPLVRLYGARGPYPPAPPRQRGWRHRLSAARARRGSAPAPESALAAHSSGTPTCRSSHPIDETFEYAIDR
jgi:hypothetical protein